MEIAIRSEGKETVIRPVWTGTSEQWTVDPRPTPASQYWDSIDAAAAAIDIRHRQVARGETPASEPDEWRR